MTSFLNFEEQKTTGKTKKFLVYSSHGGDLLGEVYWRNGWRRYVMHFDCDCDWSIECMSECYKFVAKLMQERKTEGGIPPVDKSTGILPTIL